MEKRKEHPEEDFDAPPGGKSQLVAEENSFDTQQVELPANTTATLGCCRNIYVFVAHLALLNITRVSLRTYFSGTIRTIERRFGLSSSDTGVFASVNDIPHIVLVLIFGYFGQTLHKPRVLAATLLFPAFAGYLFALPYFVLPNKAETAGGQGAISSFSNDTSDALRMRTAQLCDGSIRDEDCDLSVGYSESDERTAAYSLFLLGSIVVGVGSPAFSSLAIPYIDENTSESKTPLLVGG